MENIESNPVISHRFMIYEKSQGRFWRAAPGFERRPKEIFVGNDADALAQAVEAMREIAKTHGDTLRGAKLSCEIWRLYKNWDTSFVESPAPIIVA